MGSERHFQGVTERPERVKQRVTQTSTWGMRELLRTFTDIVLRGFIDVLIELRGGEVPP